MLVGVGFEFVFGLLFLLYLACIRYLLSLPDFVGFRCALRVCCLLGCGCLFGLLRLWVLILGCLVVLVLVQLLF